MPCCQILLVHLVRRLAVKRLMRPGLIVERQVALHALMGRTDSLVRVHIDLLVFNALPESLDEHVVPPTPFSVHADLDAVVRQEACELLAGELAPLVGIEDGWGAMLGDGLLHRVEAEIGRERIGEPPRQHPATRPVQDRKQIHEAPRHREVGDIGGPDMIGSRDHQVTQEIGVNLMGRMPPAERRLPIQGLKAHAAHQGGHMPPPHRVPLVPQEITQHAGAGKRILQMEFVDPPHQCQRRL